MNRIFFKRSKRIVSFVLMTAILLTNLIGTSVVSVLANRQSNVTDVIIRYVPSNEGTYNINFEWTNPTSWSSEIDGDAFDGETVHSPEGFRVMERNTTARETTFTNVSENTTDPNLSSSNISRVLTTGSIYGYQIMPYHKHLYIDNSGRTINRDAPYAASPAAEEVLFMSDIEVDAKGAGNYLNVTWDNPTFMGRDVFSGYRIYYQRGGDKVTTFNNYKDISIDNEDLERVSDGVRDNVTRLQYSIYDTALTQGDVYAVKVEPLYNGQEIRNLRNLSYANITINNRTYKMAFSGYTTTEYRTNEAYVSIPLEVLENGKDYLKLHWWGISTTLGDIDRVEVYKGPAENDIGVKIGTLFSSQAIYVNYWQVDKPSEVTYYQLRIYIVGSDTPIESEIAVYDPSTVNITPNKPKVFLEPVVNGERNYMNVYWNVFMRYPYNANEEEFVEANGMYIDKNVEYDVWISDTLENIEDPNLPKMLDRVSASDLTQTNIDKSDTPVYLEEMSRYIAREDGGYVTKDITQNKVYYVKIVAVKPVAGGKELVAEPAYASQYFPASGSIATPQALNKPPLKIREDNDGNLIITQNSIEIEWKTKWYEIYDSETDKWYSGAAVVDSDTILFGEDNSTSDGAVHFHNASSEDSVREMFRAKGLSEDIIALLPIRQIDISASDIQYELLALPFDEVNQNGGYLAYLETVMNSESSAWNKITPNVIDEVTDAFNVVGLEKNTTYVIILRPYRILENNKKDAYPTYIMGTTLPDSTIIEVVPTVPVLEEDGHDDTSISVKWQEQEGLKYELVYSQTPLDDPASGGNYIATQVIDADGKHDLEEEIKKIFYTINNLVPETGYYVWVRAIANSDTTPVYSSWSSPLYVVTDELGKPDVPDGLGYISQTDLDLYNKSANAELNIRGDDYAILEWMKNADDNSGAASTTTGADYDVLGSPDIVTRLIVKVNNMIANHNYYARVKAVVALNDDGNGNITKTYSYVFQYSETEDFKEFVTVIVPEDNTQGVLSKYVKESDWTNVFTFKTGKSDNEYDSDKIDDHYPLPKDDFELIYDGATKTLTYRYRHDGEGRDDLDDNLVDQRFISKLTEKKIQNVLADLSTFENKEILHRVVEIPYSIVEALSNSKITFEFKAGNVIYVLEPEFADNAEVKQLSGYGHGSTVKLISDVMPSDAPILDFNQSYASRPQKLGVQIITPSKTVDIKYLAKEMTVHLKLDDRYSLLDSNVGAYTDTELTLQWQRMNYVYDNINGSFKSTTKQLGSFSAIKNNPMAVSSSSTDVVNSVVSVSTRLHVTDVSNFKPQGVVSTVQFNNIVAAIANGKKDVAINGALPDGDYTALSRKGIVLSGATVTREEGVNALVRLYEVKTGRLIENYTPLNLTQYTDIKNATAKFQSALLKAGYIGFFNNTYGARPKDVMSMEDLFYMIDIIMQDCGM